MLRYLLPALLLSSSAFAGTFECTGKLPAADGYALISRVEKRYEAIADLRATFVQESLFVGLDKREESKGTVAFKKPGMMDWRYTDPEEQRFIADGKTVWFFQPSLNQVTIDSFKDSFQSDLPVTFLLGIGKLSNAFTLKGYCTAASGVLLDLEPKSTDSTIQRFTLLVSAGDQTPLASRILDLSGNETTITLSSLKLNSGAQEAAFRFDIPRGVDVIDQRTMNATATQPAVDEETVVTGSAQDAEKMKQRAQLRMKQK